MKVLVVEPMKAPYTKEIENNLASLQEEVGGLIRAIYPFEEPVALICNDEGKLDGLPFNRLMLDCDGRVYDYIAGTFIIVGLSDEDFCSLKEEYVANFREKYKMKEFLLKKECVSTGVEPNFMTVLSALESITDQIHEIERVDVGEYIVIKVL